MYIYGIGIKEHTLLNLKHTITAQNTHLPFFCNNLFRTSHLYLAGKTRPTFQDLTSDVPGMCRGLTLVHVHANY